MILSRLFMALSCATLAIGNGSILLDSSPVSVNADSSVVTSTESYEPVGSGIVYFGSDYIPTPSSIFYVGPNELDSTSLWSCDLGEAYYLYSATFLAGELVKFGLAYYGNGSEPVGFSSPIGIYNYNASAGGVRIYGGFLLDDSNDIELYANVRNSYGYVLYQAYTANGGDIYFTYLDFSSTLRNWWQSGGILYNLGYNEGLGNIRQSDYDEIYNEGYRDGYAVGMATPDEGTTGIIDLFGAIANVPINVLNGLGGLAVWHTPIVGIIVSFLLIGVICVVIKRFMA